MDANTSKDKKKNQTRLYHMWEWAFPRSLCNENEEYLKLLRIMDELKQNEERKSELLTEKEELERKLNIRA